ncbi:small nucleolar ribonucleoprotein complex subunit utp14 [Moniliophthora roreri]|nr:small nucleolar ribonucleoprotein complex subunit utp14 [Moniliophthora roreri]
MLINPHDDQQGFIASLLSVAQEGTNISGDLQAITGCQISLQARILKSLRKVLGALETTGHIAMHNLSNDELSLRHLPDLSDSSFSFQIPAQHEGNLLLADDEDFLRDADDFSLTATPAPHRVRREALTVSQVTPKPIASPSKHHSSPLPLTSSSTILMHSPKPNIRKLATDPSPEKKKKVREKTFDNPKSSAKMLDVGYSTPKRLASLKEGIATFALGSEMTVDPSSTFEPPTSTSQSHMVIQRLSEHRTVTAKGRLKPVDNDNGCGPEIGPPCSLHSAPVPCSVEQKDMSVDGLRMTLASAVDGQGEDMSVDTSTCDGLAGRLVMYSKEMIASCRESAITSTSENSGLSSASSSHDPSTLPCISPADDKGNQGSNPVDDSLTLSQLSPRKERFSPHEANPPSDSLSALRPSYKRPSSATSDCQPRKKGKTTHSQAHTTRAIAPVTRTSAKRRREVWISSGSVAERAKAKVEKKRVVSRDNVHSSQTSSIGASSIASSSSTSSRLVTKTLRAKAGLTLGSGMSTFQTKSLTSSNKGRSLTKPFESTFHSESRIAGRKIETTENPDTLSQNQNASTSTSVQPKSKKLLHAHREIPDFKASHAALDAATASRKEHIIPVVPMNVGMFTEARAREREKFDARMREKEMETEIALEQRRREREQEEEREIKELRKKAVPKAHEVPEWYKDMPKRKDRGEKVKER